MPIINKIARWVRLWQISLDMNVNLTTKRYKICYSYSKLQQSDIIFLSHSMKHLKERNLQFGVDMAVYQDIVLIWGIF